MSAAESGDRLEAFIRAAIGRSREIANIAELCRAADINRNTIYAWFQGTAVPSPPAMARTAAALDVPVSDLYAAWEGRDAMPTSTEEALALLVAKMAENNDHLARLIEKLDGVGDRALAEELVLELRRQKPPPEKGEGVMDGAGSRDSGRRADRRQSGLTIGKA